MQNKEWTMFELREITVLSVVHGEVEKFAGLPPLTGDRALKPTRVEHLADRIHNGLAIPFLWVTCFVDGVEYRINGQHSCEVLLGMDSKTPPSLKVVRIVFDADSVEDAAVLWAQYDAQISTRVANEIYTTRAAAIPELADFAPRFISRCATGLGMDHYGIRRGDAAGRAELLSSNVARIHWLYNLIATASQTATTEVRDALERGPVIAAMIRTHRRSAQDATSFWNAVRDGTDTNPGHPTRILRDYLLSHSVANGRGSTGTRSASSVDVLVCCIRAWNAWRKHVTVKLLRSHVRGEPIPQAE
jgi:hypothetical protein